MSEDSRIPFPAVKERKLIIDEERRCSRCGRKFIVDVIWERHYRINKRGREINTDHFHSLCPEHKLAEFGPLLAQEFVRGILSDWDMRSMQVTPGDLELIRRLAELG